MTKVLRVAPYCRVSTRGREQVKSLRSTILHYTNLVNTKSDWKLVDVYVDAAMSGTRADNRVDFQRMIEDCKKGLIDLIVTKSLSRFSRNADDIMYFIYMLREINVAVFFEVENINTLTMSEQEEEHLIFLASAMQQEANNASANSRTGLQMKMKRGELVGFNKCLGYDYDISTKSLAINEEEAKVVHYIFQRYLKGAGAFTIAKELTGLGYKTKYGSTEWGESTVRGILKNEKYKGAVLQGKTVTIDPVLKRRKVNSGESDKYLCENHHEPIISEDVWSKVDKEMKERSRAKDTMKGTVRRKQSSKYTFSSKIECAFCHSNFSRRSWSGKPVWQCVTNTKQGKQYCEHAKGISENMIEEAFVNSYNELLLNKAALINDLLRKEESDLDTQQHIVSLISLLETNKRMEKFDRDILSSIIENIIVGELDNRINPYMLTFNYKAGISNNTDVKVVSNLKNTIEHPQQINNNRWLHIPSSRCQ